MRLHLHSSKKISFLQGNPAFWKKKPFFFFYRMVILSSRYFASICCWLWVPAFRTFWNILQLYIIKSLNLCPRKQISFLDPHKKKNWTFFKILKPNFFVLCQYFSYQGSKNPSVADLLFEVHNVRDFPQHTNNLLSRELYIILHCTLSSLPILSGTTSYKNPKYGVAPNFKSQSYSYQDVCFRRFKLLSRCLFGRLVKEVVIDSLVVSLGSATIMRFREEGNVAVRLRR